MAGGQQDPALFHHNHLRPPADHLPGLPPAMAGDPDGLLTAESDKNDYDWLVTPPGTPLFPAPDPSPHKAPSARPLARLKPPQLAAAMEPSLRLSTSSSIFPCTNNGISFPASRATSRHYIATARTSTHAATTRSASLSRPSTPTRRPSTPTFRSNNLPGHLPPRSSSVGKTSSLAFKNAAVSRGSSPMARVYPWQPSDMRGFSLDPPANLRTTERSPSSRRGRSILSLPGAPTATRSSQSEIVDAKNRSRSRSRHHSSFTGTSRCLLPGSQSRDSIYAGNGRRASPSMEFTAPVVMGSKGFEKVTRATPTSFSRDDHTNTASVLQMKQVIKATTSTINDTLGFGRNVSKKSLDMARRHTDSRGGARNEFAPLVPNVPASSLCSVRSASVAQTWLDTSASDSLMSINSSGSSQYSMSIVQEQEDRKLGNETSTEKGSKLPPISQLDSAFKDVRISNWIHGPDHTDDSVELMHIFTQGIEESLLVSQSWETSCL